MISKLISFILLTSILFMAFSCSKNEKVNPSAKKSSLDTLVVTPSMKGWELYSWPKGNDWHFSLMSGTNRTKTLEEVTSFKSSDLKLVQVIGFDSLKMVLDKFPQGETITWIGQGWLQRCWNTDYGHLQLPPQPMIDELSEYCMKRKLNLLVTD